jgi:NADPH-dependent ferric siderophore reductase
MTTHESDTTDDEAVRWAELNRIRTFVTSVRRVERRTPGVARITFGGGDLDQFVPKGPDQFLYVLLPPPGRRQLTVDAGFTWEQYQSTPDEERPVGAYYSVVAHRPADAEIDMDFVLHGDAGHASGWAARAAAGDPVALWGPREMFDPPADTRWFLLVADDTALPALASILAWLPPGAPARVFIEVADGQEQIPLPSRGHVTVTWLHRDGAHPGTTTALADAVRETTFLDGTPYAWGGGDSKAMTAIRRYLRRVHGLSRRAVCMTPYWRSPGHVEADDEMD